MNSTYGELQCFPRSRKTRVLMHVNMDVSQYKRVAYMHVDIQHSFHIQWVFMEKGTCDQLEGIDV